MGARLKQSFARVVIGGKARPPALPGASECGHFGDHEGPQEPRVAYAAGPRRVSIDGPPLRLPPKAALALGMAVHELTTNAAKHGALSVESGQVSVSWSVPAPGAAVSLTVPEGVVATLPAGTDNQLWQIGDRR